jgi:hypothetical protein
MPEPVVTVTIRDDVPSEDGTWPAVDTWGRRVRVSLREGPDAPRTARRGQALRGVLVGDRVIDAGF